MAAPNRTKALVRAARKQIVRRKALLEHLKKLPPELAETAYHVFGTEAGAAEWLMTPAHGLNGKVPVIVAQNPAGRKKVVTLIIRIDQGVAI